MEDVTKIKRLLIFIVVVLALYVLKILSFIFIPLISAIFLALLFMPLMRWLKKKRVPKAIAVTISTLIMAAVLFGAAQLVRLSTKQIINEQDEFWENADSKLQPVWQSASEMLGIETSASNGENLLQQLMQSEEVSQTVRDNFGSTLGFAQRMVLTILMILFFLILLLAGSLNVQKLMEILIFNQKNSSVKAFREIEHSIVKFIKVKTLTSLLTGLGFGITCYFFGVSFPLFWGLIAFALNYVQMIGSVVVTIALVLFAFIDLHTTGTLLGFALILTGVQLLFGGVLEPILMGQSFLINTITVLVMLMLWGYIWGVAGLILSIPITAMLKIIFEQLPGTRFLSRIMS